jgi:hypothetical protein
MVVAAGAITVEDKRRLARDIGKQLSSTHGKREHYAPAIIKAAMRKLRYAAQWDCWALCLFATMDEFNAYYRARGENCDYSATRSSMLAAINPSAPTDMNTVDGWSVATDLLNLLD